MEKTVFQQNIKFIRNRMKLTQADLAEKLDIKQDQVEKYENRGTVPKPPVMDSICTFFGFSREILEGTLLTNELYDKYRKKVKHKAEEDAVTMVNEENEKYGITVDQLFAQQNKLLISLNKQSETANNILERMANTVEKKVDQVDINLTDALGRIDSLKLDLYSGRKVVLQSLARLEKKPVNSLLTEADSITAAILGRQKQTQSKNAEKGK